MKRTTDFIQILTSSSITKCVNHGSRGEGWWGGGKWRKMLENSKSSLDKFALAPLSLGKATHFIRECVIYERRTFQLSTFCRIIQILSRQTTLSESTNNILYLKQFYFYHCYPFFVKKMIQVLTVEATLSNVRTDVAIGRMSLNDIIYLL